MKAIRAPNRFRQPGLDAHARIAALELRASLVERFGRAANRHALNLGHMSVDIHAPQQPSLAVRDARAIDAANVEAFASDENAFPGDSHAFLMAVTLPMEMRLPEGERWLWSVYMNGTPSVL